MSPQGVAAGVFVARQPIFDRHKKVYGYELLFRSGLENCYRATDADASTLDVIANSLLEIGLDELTGGKRGFINFTRNLLVRDVAALIPAEGIVVEILEDIPPDDDVLAACRRLKATGYVLALDDFVLDHTDHPLLALADIVKVDCLGTTTDVRRRLGRDLAGRGVTALAEKVETAEVFAETADAGYALFQGYFFSKPVVHTGRALESNKLLYLQMLERVNRPEVSYEEIEAVVKQDVSLTYKLLRFINSAWFGLRSRIDSVRHALVWLGPKELRKWAALVALRSIAGDKPGELLLRSMVLAKMAEAMAGPAGLQKHRDELFLMGMFAFIDALLDLPMAEALAKLPLSEDVRRALLGQESPYAPVHHLIVAYERGDWDTFASLAADFPDGEHALPAIFAQSVQWATQAMASLDG